MQIIRTLIKRNLLLFFKDKTAVFFSFMAVFVVLFLYICFLGDYMIKPLRKDFYDTAREISDTWIMAGTLGIVSLTTSLSVLGIVIHDKSKKIIHDFYITYATKLQIDIAYICSTILITCIVSIITFIIAQLYIVAYGGQFLNFEDICRVGMVMVLSITSSSTLLYFFMSFFQSSSSFSNVTTIIGTLSGFLMGIYVPIGSLPRFLQCIISYFPPSHAAALFREVMMRNVLERSIPSSLPNALHAFKEQFGLVFTYGSFVSTPWMNVFVLMGTGILFLVCIQIKHTIKKCKN